MVAGVACIFCKDAWSVAGVSFIFCKYDKMVAGVACSVSGDASRFAGDAKKFVKDAKSVGKVALQFLGVFCMLSTFLPLIFGILTRVLE